MPACCLLVSNVFFHPGGERVVQRLQGAIEGGIQHAPLPDHPSAIQGPDEGAIIVVVADFNPAMGRDPLPQVRERLIRRPGPWAALLAYREFRVIQVLIVAASQHPGISSLFRRSLL